MANVAIVLKTRARDVAGIGLQIDGIKTKILELINGKEGTKEEKGQQLQPHFRLSVTHIVIIDMHYIQLYYTYNELSSVQNIKIYVTIIHYALF